MSLLKDVQFSGKGNGDIHISRAAARIAGRTQTGLKLGIRRKHMRISAVPMTCFANDSTLNQINSVRAPPPTRMQYVSTLRVSTVARRLCRSSDEPTIRTFFSKSDLRRKPSESLFRLLLKQAGHSLLLSVSLALAFRYILRCLLHWVDLG